jgi:predicted transcriptional regulator
MPTVKLDDESHRALQALARSQDVTMSALLKEAIRHLQRERFWDGVREDFERLRKDKKAWAEYQAEAEAIQAAPDGLNDETEEWAALYPELNLRKPAKRGRK